MTRRIRLSLAAVGCASALLLTACGGQTSPAAPSSDAASSAASSDGTSAGLSGSVAADGSSTVAPLTEAAADKFRDVEAGINVTVATSGTGGGFQKFCAGETDISNASRAIKDEEAQACADAGIEFTEIIMANDGLAVVINPENDWAECLTVEQLQAMWAPESEGQIMNWNQIDPSFPDQALTLFGAGTDSGTFDYFTDAINGEEGASRTDYAPSEDDNITIQGVSGDKGAVGYFGLSYVEENPDIIKAVQVDNGAGCVAPSKETVQSGEYAPLSRPLFIYVANNAYTEKPQVKSFVDFYVENEAEIAESALFVGLTEEQKATALEELASLS
ncbi:PstS family phosphate ABC transporter substrate-binding protein [Tessaracoccus sp. MC1679]|uniref:PstS family phosphate ABC transporter substrate-binding protein n=1 Tax=Tessaracoccus sp. MC1679 TaxID=2760313 RepID=UPI00160484B3|nr:PstS family phosphate ABC transporter substrate-binding protein [Tessaracoccus sp. MC1679]MBB1515314.1 PstS family phosphate ABC transporter substrate-binding protein [Tessaracoccus sp. MC1679]